jgi:hypothetical protein
MINKENIKMFVRETLGCECPDAVFEYIDSKLNVKLNEDILLNDKINIGNRLLIYIIKVNDTKFIKTNLSKLISIGKNERDLKGFNRFRLVIFTDKVDEIRQIAHNIFKRLENKDEKVYLHIIDGSQSSPNKLGGLFCEEQE